MNILGIDRGLSDRDKKGLVWSYKKYNAYNAASQLMDQLNKQGKWPLPKKASQTELVEIFMSKSYWHSHVWPAFHLIARYPQMVAWLEQEDSDDPSDFEVWHVQKSEYGFKELMEWIENDGTLDKPTMEKLEKAKGKRRKMKGKGKLKEDFDEDRGDVEKEEMEIDKKEEVGKKGKGSGSKPKQTHKRK